MNEPNRLSAAVSAAAPDGAGDIGTVLALDEGAALEALSAYFGAADERQAVRIVVGGEELGYVERGQALALLDVQSRDLGHSSGWTLPGVSDYEGIELRCPVDGCPANPIFAGSFDETYPPDCPLHPGQTLNLAQA
jgi:hypothetical protein